ncbi:hypothetical protein B5D77_23220 [Microcystis sp. MC19]|nr:hypothetical protein B5D77_23220 [Microcystis sp. MC19]
MTYTYIHNRNPCLPANPSFLGGIDQKKSTDLNQLSVLSFKFSDHCLLITENTSSFIIHNS